MGRNRQKNREDKKTKGRDKSAQRQGHFLTDEEYAKYERFCRIESVLFDSVDNVKNLWVELLQSAHDTYAMDLITDCENGKEVQNAINEVARTIDQYRFKANRHLKSRAKYHVSHNNKHIHVVGAKHKKLSTHDIAFQKTDNKLTTEEFSPDFFDKNQFIQDAIYALKEENETDQSIKNVTENSLFTQYVQAPNEEIKKISNKDIEEAIKQDEINQQLEDIKRNPWFIQHIANPSEEVQKLAVQQDGYAIQFITDPSKEVQKLAVQQNGNAIQHIANPNEELQKVAVQQNGYAMRFIKNPSEEIKRLAHDAELTKIIN